MVRGFLDTGSTVSLLLQLRLDETVRAEEEARVKVERVFLVLEVEPPARQAAVLSRFGIHGGKNAAGVVELLKLERDCRLSVATQDDCETVSKHSVRKRRTFDFTNSAGRVVHLERDDTRGAGPCIRHSSESNENGHHQDRNLVHARSIVVFFMCLTPN
jgi:hypothetical protein